MPEKERAAAKFFATKTGKVWADATAGEKAAATAVVEAKGVPFVVMLCTRKPYAADWT